MISRATTLAGGLLTTGVLHGVAPQPFDTIVPPWLPGSARFWTYASGAAELAVGAAVAVPRTRRLGALAAAALFVAAAGLQFFLVDGQEMTDSGPRAARAAGIEMVYQDLALCNDIDVAANLFLGREIYHPLTRRLDHARMHAEAAEDLKTLHIRITDTTQEVGNMSGGQRQAIAIARAVTFEPKVLVLDEPTAALAAKEVEMVLQLIRDVSARGVSVVLITHRLQDLFEVCDRFVVLYEGVLHRELVPAETDLTELVTAMMGK